MHAEINYHLILLNGSSAVHTPDVLRAGTHRRPRQPHPEPLRAFLPRHRPCGIIHLAVCQGAVRDPSSDVL